MKSKFGESHQVGDSGRPIHKMQTIRPQDGKAVQEPAEQWPRISQEMRNLFPNTGLLKLSGAYVDRVKDGDPDSAPRAFSSEKLPGNLQLLVMKAV